MASSGTIPLKSSKAWEGYISWTVDSQDIVNITSTVTAKVYTTKTDGYVTSGGGYFTGSLTVGSGSASISYAQEEKTHTLRATKTVVIQHNSDGTGTAYIGASITKGSSTSLAGVTLSGGQEVTLPTIACASTISVGNGTLGVEQEITAAVKGNTFTHTLTWSCGGESGTIAEKDAGTRWRFAPPVALAEQVPNSNYLQMTFTLLTFSGNSQIGSSAKTVTIAVPSTVAPTLEMTVEDATDNFLELGQYLQTQSKLKIKVVAAGAYGSKITTISVTADGVTYNNTLSTPTETTEYSFTTGVLNGEGRQRVVATATDSRGRSASVTVQIEIQSYNAPRITQLVVHRCNEDGTENQSGLFAKVTYSFSVSAASAGTVKLLYKKTQDTEYEKIDLPGGQSVENASVVFAADDGSPYDIELVITDSYGSASRSTKLSTGYTIMHFPASGRGVTFGGVATRGGFNVNMVARFNRGLLYRPKVLNRGDCDSLLESGVYFIGNYGTGRPPGNSVGWLEVLSINDGYFCAQRYVTPDFQCWIRYRMNDLWEEWRRIFAYKEE